MGVASFAILGSICLGWFALAGRQALEMRKSHDYRSSWAWAFWALLPAGVFSLLSFANGDSDVVARNVTLGALGAVIGASALIWAGYALQHAPAQAQTPSPQGAPVAEVKPTIPQSFTGAGNFSVNQQGGTVNQTYVNQQPLKLKFTEELGGELLTKIPKDKPLNIMLTGTQADLQVGEDFANFFRRNGYNVSYKSAMMLFPTPEHQLTLTDLPESRDLVIAPSVR